jgi:hypothetical protein
MSDEHFRQLYNSVDENGAYNSFYERQQLDDVR